MEQHGQKKDYVTADGFEICVLCGKKTAVKCTVPIDRRAGYIEGCGQLCSECLSDLCRDDYH